MQHRRGAGDEFDLYASQLDESTPLREDRRGLARDGERADVKGNRGRHVELDGALGGDFDLEGVAGGAFRGSGSDGTVGCQDPVDGIGYGGAAGGMVVFHAREEVLVADGVRGGPAEVLRFVLAAGGRGKDDDGEPREGDDEWAYGHVPGGRRGAVGQGRLDPVVNVGPEGRGGYATAGVEGRG